MPNILAKERSPFLLEHSDDLVNWMPWGDEAFNLAQTSGKFIFLSVGSSSSKWCDSMRRECFLDTETAELMNLTCVCVLVDAEERPDITALFSDVCRIQNGGSGIPLNVMLTPEGAAFFAATWLPKRSTPSLPGLVDILPRTKWLWITQKDNVYRSAESLTEEINKHAIPHEGGVPGSFQAKAAFRELSREFDSAWGGFTSIGTQKRISAPRLIFLLDFAQKYKKLAAFEMAEKTLQKMWLGGIHDHIGRGFFDSSADERWIIPDFHKGLANHAQLLYTAALMKVVKKALAPLDARLEAPSDFELSLAGEAADFMLKELAAPESVFRSSAETANDSYYLWTEDEIRAVLPQSDFAVFSQAFSVMSGGNFRHDLTGLKTGQNILYMGEGLSAVAGRYYSKPEVLGGRLSEMTKVLFEARAKRPGLVLNDQAFLSSNGLAIAALAFAGKVFENKDWILASERALLFSQKTFPDPKGNWRRRFCVRDKAADLDAQFIDLICLAWGAVEVHLATNAVSTSKKDIWLKFAESVIAKTEELFADKGKHAGGFFATDGRDARIVRRKLCEDGTIPGGNAIAVRVFSMLAQIFDEAPEKGKDAPNFDAILKERAEKAKKYRHAAKETAAAFVRPASNAPASFAFLLATSPGASPWTR